MRATIVSNTIQSPDGASVGEAVLEAIGELSAGQAWRVWINEPQDRIDYIVTIEGPAFKWRRGFFGPYEQTAAFIYDEVRKAVTGTPKATIVPLHHVDHGVSLEGPIPILDSVSVEAIDGLLTPEHFSLWRESISPRSVKSMTSARFALVHRFRSGYSIGRTEIESKDLLFRVFTCLRLLKATKAEFATIQINVTETGGADVFSFEEPPQIPLNIPTSELMNSFSLNDFVGLSRTIGPFLLCLERRPKAILRAIRYFNVGYQGIHDSVIQIVTWVMAIESLFNDTDRALPRNELFKRINARIGGDSDIYEQSAMRQYFGESGAKVGDLLPDLFELRDCLIHGLWIPEKFENKLGHDLPGQERVTYADELREASHYILRKSLLNAISQ